MSHSWSIAGIELIEYDEEDWRESALEKQLAQIWTRYWQSPVQKGKKKTRTSDTRQDYATGITNCIWKVAKR